MEGRLGWCAGRKAGRDGKEEEGEDDEGEERKGIRQMMRVENWKTAEEKKS